MIFCSIVRVAVAQHGIRPTARAFRRPAYDSTMKFLNLHILLALLSTSATGYSANEGGGYLMESAVFYDTGLFVDIISKPCLGPPYLYVTTLERKTNILKYTRDGCFLSDRVLIDGPASSTYIDFRSMALPENGDLYVANAAEMNGGVLAYGPCSGPNSTLEREENDTAGMREGGSASSGGVASNASGAAGQRAYKGVVTNVRANPGAERPYGLALDFDQVLLHGNSARSAARARRNSERGVVAPCCCSNRSRSRRQGLSPCCRRSSCCCCYDRRHC